VATAAASPGAKSGPPARPGRPPAATPVARRLAENIGVDLATVVGTGPGGRITKDDVGESGRRRPRAAVVPALGGTAKAPTGTGATIPLQGMRRVIAERMHASLQEMAQLTLGMEVDMTDAARLRRQLVDEWAGDGLKVTYTDLVCRAAVKALAAHPGLNASVGPDAITVHPAVNLGVAVAVPGGLLVPVVTDAQDRGLKDFAAESARLAAATRDGTLTLDELEGATFTVTALGAQGVDFFTPVVNPPNVAILGVGRIHDGVAWEGDRAVKRQVMTLSLTIDHRAVDGVPGADFLGEVRNLLESPYRLLV